MKKNFIHPTAIVECDLKAENIRIWAFVHILKDVKIGNNCNIADHVYVESGADIGNNVTLKNNICVWEGITIEDDVFIGPHVTFTNDRFPRSPRMDIARMRYLHKENWLLKTVVGKGSSIGANATITCGVKIGCYSMIAAGATVTKDVAPFALVVGSPAQQVGYVCRCGQRIGSEFPQMGCHFCNTPASFFSKTVAKKSKEE
jgi:acetyltransferase-like isoleucine patch superfamily enzyme